MSRTDGEDDRIVAIQGGLQTLDVEFNVVRRAWIGICIGGWICQQSIERDGRRRADGQGPVARDEAEKEIAVSCSVPPVFEYIK